MLWLIFLKSLRRKKYRYIWIFMQCCTQYLVAQASSKVKEKLRVQTCKRRVEGLKC